MDRVTVNAKALHEVLTALISGGYLIKELQVTREPKELFADNPINILVDEYNKAAALPVAAGAGEVELTDDLRKILSMMCFQLSRYAHLMRKVGFKVERKAEDEQAVTLHWLLNHYFAHGKDWHMHADADVQRWLAEVAAMTPATPAGKGLDHG